MSVAAGAQGGSEDDANSRAARPQRGDVAGGGELFPGLVQFQGQLGDELAQRAGGALLIAELVPGGAELAAQVVAFGGERGERRGLGIACSGAGL
jgi:hypothetical protein